MDSRITDAADEIIEIIIQYTEPDSHASDPRESKQDIRELIKPVLFKYFSLIQEDTMLDSAMKAIIFRDQDKDSNPRHFDNADDIANVFLMS